MTNIQSGEPTFDELREMFRACFPVSAIGTFSDDNLEKIKSNDIDYWNRLVVGYWQWKVNPAIAADPNFVSETFRRTKQ